MHICTFTSAYCIRSRENEDDFCHVIKAFTTSWTGMAAKCQQKISSNISSLFIGWLTGKKYGAFFTSNKPFINFQFDATTKKTEKLLRFWGYEKLNRRNVNIKHVDAQKVPELGACVNVPVSASIKTAAWHLDMVVMVEVAMRLLRVGAHPVLVRVR